MCAHSVFQSSYLFWAQLLPIRCIQPIGQLVIALGDIVSKDKQLDRYGKPSWFLDAISSLGHLAEGRSPGYILTDTPIHSDLIRTMSSASFHRFALILETLDSCVPPGTARIEHVP